MSTLSEYLKIHSTISSKFIDEFFTYHDFKVSYDEIYINFESVAQWINVRKADLKGTLINNYIKNIDYTLKRTSIKKASNKSSKKASKKSSKKSLKKKREKAGRPSEMILISPDCFRRLCMISRTKKAEEVRSYFIELEKHVDKYKDYIINGQYKKIGVLQNNQKPKIDPQAGVIYVFKTELDIEGIYKIGKTKDFKNRLKTHNSSHPDDVDVVLIYEATDIDVVENCLKAILKNTQYRNKKEFYQVDLDILKKLLTGCDKLFLVSKKSPKKLNQKGGLYFYIQK